MGFTSSIAIGLIINYIVRRRTINSLEDGILSNFSKKEIMRFCKRHNINITTGSRSKKELIKTIYNYYKRAIKNKQITYRNINSFEMKNLRFSNIIKYNLGNSNFIYTGDVKNLRSQHSRTFQVKAKNLKQLKNRIMLKKLVYFKI